MLYLKKISVCFALVFLAISPVANSFGLSEESEEILSKYQEYKENNAPIQRSTETQIAQNSQEKITNNYNKNFEVFKPLIIVAIVLVIIAAVVTGAYKRELGSYNHPPSMKQLRWLRNSGYSGRMPTSSREAHKIISDIQRGGDGNFERGNEYDQRRSRFR